MKYIIELKKRGRWKKTWWTSYPSAAVEDNDAVIPVSKSKANKALMMAQKFNPKVEYRISEAE